MCGTAPLLEPCSVIGSSPCQKCCICLDQVAAWFDAMAVAGSLAHTKPLHPQNGVQREKHDEVVKGNKRFSPIEGRARQHPTRMCRQFFPQQSKAFGRRPW